MTADLPDRSADREREAPHPASTFEQLLRDPYGQFDRKSELLASIQEYMNAPPATFTAPAALAARPAPDDGKADAVCTTLGCENPGTVTGTFHDHDVDYRATYCTECVEAVGDWFEPDAAAPSSPGSGDALYGRLTEVLAAPFGRGNRYWAERAAAALLPVVREVIADELDAAARGLERDVIAGRVSRNVVRKLRIRADALRGHQDTT